MHAHLGVAARHGKIEAGWRSDRDFQVPSLDGPAVLRRGPAQRGEVRRHLVGLQLPAVPAVAFPGGPGEGGGGVPSADDRRVGSLEGAGPLHDA